MNRKSLQYWIIVLAVIRFILPFVLQNNFYQPHRDEYLYLAEGKHMDWGYMEIPPLLSVFAWATDLLGGSFFWIKFWPSLFGSLTFLLVANMILSLGGRWFGIILGWLPFVINGYLRLFFLFMPNFLDVFFWTLMAYSIFQYIQTRKTAWIYWFGIALGLGMMSKYSVAFYGLSLLLALLFTRHRRLLINKNLLFTCGIAFLIFLPNLIWQYNHRFPVVKHMQELEETQLRFIGSVGFLADQFFMNLPTVFVWITGLLGVFFSARLKAYRLFGWAYLLVIFLLLSLHGKSYYALGSYPVLFALGAYQLEQFTRLRFRWLRYAMLIFALTVGGIALPLILPMFKPDALVKYYQKTGLNKTGDFNWEDLQRHPLPQDFADMMGWKEMTAKAAAVYKNLPPDQQAKTMVYCRGYFSAGALNYYGPEYGLPEAISDNASFLLWMPDKADINNLILVGHRIPGKDDKVFQQFQKYTVMDSVDMPLFRENGMKFILYQNANDSLKTIVENAIREVKDQFRR